MPRACFKSSLSLADPAPLIVFLTLAFCVGAGSFFKSVNAANGPTIDLFEGGSTTGLLVRHFPWHGSVRIWWHGERQVLRADAHASS